MADDLKKTVAASLTDRKGDWKSVADASGVSHSWIVKFMNSHIPKPGYDTLLKLQSYFDGLKAAKKAVAVDKTMALAKKPAAKKAPAKKPAPAKKAAKRPALKRR